MKAFKVYKIYNDKGVLVLREIPMSDISGGINHRYDTNDVLINPQIFIDDGGILRVTGKRHSYVNVLSRDNSYEYIPTKTTDLTEGFKDLIFYNESDIVLKDVKTYSGIWPLRKKNIEKDVEHLHSRAYLRKEFKLEDIKTSNFRIYNL